MSLPLKVGLLTPAFSGVTGQDSGIGAHFRHLADGLTAAGHTVVALVVTDKSTSAPALPYPVHVVAVSKPALARVAGRFSWQLHQWFNLRDAMSAARHAAQKIEADIWETTSTGSLARDLLGDRDRAPIVTRVSTTATQLRSTNAGRLRWINRQIEAWEHITVRRSDRVFTHSHSHRDAIATEFQLAPDSIRIIPHGIPIPPASTRAPNASGCSILYVGRLEHRKGLDLLIAALPAVLHAAPQATVMLVGADQGAHWQHHWQQTAPVELRNRVRFAGLVDAAALAAHYRAADVFVAPSRYESFGLIFVEAMAHALPVVALRAPGAVDLMENDVTGRLVPQENADALAAALSELALDPAQRQRIGAAARRSVEQNYSLQALAAASTAFYRESLAIRR